MELIPPNTIHIINLNHYLENSPFAQYLLEHNKQMEPNMNFKIWTENDELVKNNFYNYFDISCKAASVAMEAVYLYGGTYCELDFEYLHKDFYYNLYCNEPDIIYTYNSIFRLWEDANYFLKKKNEISKISAQLLINNNKNDEWLATTEQQALFHHLLDEKKLREMREMREKKKGFEKNNIFHYKGLRKNIKFCKLENFYKNKITGIWSLINKYYILGDKENIDCECFCYSYEVFNKYRLREIYNLLSKFPQFEIEVLDDCLD